MTPQRWLASFVLLGALLLFSLEPLTGKLLLPSYGGSFAVWTACLTWFQGALFLAYLYCHLIGRRIGLGHLVVLALPLAWLPVGVTPGADVTSPTASIAWTLTRDIGLPFFALATTSVIAQQWLVSHTRRANPYPLYAASNLGSFLALLLYPVLIEPLLGLREQRLGWSVLYGVYLLVAALAAWRLRAGVNPAPTSEAQPEAEAEPEPEPEAKANPPGEAPERGPAALHWFLLSAIPSAFLLATTNVITMDVGSFPFVWVLPLALYLLTFVAVFRPQPWCPGIVRRFWLEFSLVGVFFYRLGGIEAGGLVTATAILGYMLVLGAVCLVAHRELYRIRPAPERLSSFYLVVSLGGWAGGLFVSLLAPLLFTGLTEYPASVAALALALLYGRLEHLQDWLAEQPRALLAGSAFILIFVPIWLFLHPGAQAEFRHRNFYGTYAIVDYPQRGELPRRRTLVHGTTTHGMQLLDRPGETTSYYGTASPISRALSTTPSPRRVAIVGLGSGVIAIQMRPADELTYFELDPDNEEIARRYFTYLESSRARTLKVVVGDARLELSKRAPASFDVIVVDAFSSDAIPVHLLTREALAIYQERLAPGGLLTIHISNRFYDLRPALASTGGALGLDALFAQTDRDARANHEAISEWCVLGATPERTAALRALDFKTPAELGLHQARPWTDDHVDLLGAILDQLRRL